MGRNYAIDPEGLMRAAATRPEILVDFVTRMDDIKAEAAERLAYLPLVTPEQLEEARTLQARVIGMDLAVTVLSELLEDTGEAPAEEDED